jgi:hypothetical protein
MQPKDPSVAYLDEDQCASQNDAEEGSFGRPETFINPTCRAQDRPAVAIAAEDHRVVPFAELRITA